MSATNEPAQMPPASSPKVPATRRIPPNISEAAYQLAPYLILLGVLVGLAVFVPDFSERFFRQNNIRNILIQASTTGLMAIGLTFVLITGGIDLSIPAVMALSAITGAITLNETENIPLSLLVMLVTGGLMGSINGYAVAYLRLIPFVATLAMLTIATGTSIWVTNSVSVPMYNEGLDSFFRARDFQDWNFYISRPFLILVILATLAFVVVKRSLFGRWLYSVGINANAAKISGVPVRIVTFATYVISGLFAGMTAILLSVRLGAASANMGNDGVVLDVISSAVVGGVSIYGGRGNPLGAVFGAIFITMISNTLNMLQMSFSTGLIIKGVVIIAFIALDSLRR